MLRGLNVQSRAMNSTQIMLVDDNPGMLALFSRILKRGNYDLLLACSAADALALLEQTTPDLIITDMLMPGMDGIELCRKIRTQRRTANIPLFVLTAWPDNASRDDAMAAGADEFLSKPISVDSFIGKVRAALQMK